MFKIGAKKKENFFLVLIETQSILLELINFFFSLSYIGGKTCPDHHHHHRYRRRRRHRNNLESVRSLSLLSVRSKMITNFSNLLPSLIDRFKLILRMLNRFKLILIVSSLIWLTIFSLVYKINFNDQLKPFVNLTADIDQHNRFVSKYSFSSSFHSSSSSSLSSSFRNRRKNRRISKQVGLILLPLPPNLFSPKISSSKIFK